MKSWLKASLISIVILTALTLYLPHLMKHGLNAFLPWMLTATDVEEPQLFISNMSWRQLTLEQLSVSFPEGNNELGVKHLSLKNLVLNYSPWQLVSGKLNTLTLAHAKLTLSDHHRDKTSTSVQKTATPSSNSTSEQPIALLTADALFNALPVQTIDVDEFIIVHPEGIITSDLHLDQQQIRLNNTLTTKHLIDDIQHKFIITQQGDISSVVTRVSSNATAKPSSPTNYAAPIFNLQAQWQPSAETDDTLQLNLQQSADLQSWFNLLPQQNTPFSINSAVAIQAWNLELSLPKIFSPADLFTSLAAQGLWQIKISDLYFDHQAGTTSGRNHSTTLVEHLNVSAEIQTVIDPSQQNQWQLTLNSLDVDSDINAIDSLKLTLKQQLKESFSLACGIQQPSIRCNWQGEILQELHGEHIANSTHLKITGDYHDDSDIDRQINSQQTFIIKTKQENNRWPKVHNSSQGDLIFQATQTDTLQADAPWHWQLNLPYGMNNISQLLQPLDTDKPGQLSAIHWQLLPDWQLTGIDHELTSAKIFSVIIEQLQWQNANQSLALEYARINCNLDWLKLQYSPLLRSQQSLAALPLFCDWDIKNATSQWNQWPLPAFTLKGHLDLSSLDLKHAQLDTQMTLSGLNNTLDLTLLAQHDFSQLQKGSAQLYLNNLALNWQKMGVNQLASLTQAQLLEGSLSAQGWIQWQQYQVDIFDDSNIAWRWQPDLMLRVDDLAGIYQESTTWEDIDLQLALRRPFYKDFRIDSQISALSINPGINVENILARSTTTLQEDFTQALIVVEEVHSDVLGGRINVPLVRYDTRQDINAFGIEVEGIDIEKIAALEANSGVTASGYLDGVLPIILLPQGPQIPAGSLFARAPGGMIKFTGETADNLRQSDPSVGLAMQVLSDFRYDKLQTNVIYQPSGELTLGLQFQGKNPTFFDGQATHLNLNLDYNLLDLLESLRISNDLVQKLENKYQ